MNPETFVNATNTLAEKNDRWLFIGSLVVIGIICYFVARYFVKLFENLIQDHKQSRTEHTVALTKICADQNETAKSLAVCIDRNTTALNECRDELATCRKARI